MKIKVTKLTSFNGIVGTLIVLESGKSALSYVNVHSVLENNVELQFPTEVSQLIEWANKELATMNAEELTDKYVLVMY